MQSIVAASFCASGSRLIQPCAVMVEFSFLLRDCIYQQEKNKTRCEKYIEKLKEEGIKYYTQKRIKKIANSGVNLRYSG